MLDVKHYDVSIGRIRIVNGAELAVAEGEFCGLIGTNGAGKTTFMRGLMGALPAAGHASIDAHDLVAARPHERVSLGIGYMPEDRRLVPDLTVEENILLPAWTARMADAGERLAWIVGFMPEIKDMLTRNAATLSGGQQKMAALARALMAGRRLLILDEPFEGLAPALVRRLGEVLAGLKRERVSVLIAESHADRVADLLDKTFLIERGVIRPPT
ncbi:MAG TPA: ATP-binding cassette domain-containing protein [Xanthobacteraceae bacterium]|nr:ATP-binding cassette domain-containing protein [Xanthobacteraceae bacterium]